MGSGVTQGVLHDPRPHPIVAFLRELPVTQGTRVAFLSRRSQACNGSTGRD
jgi:hypothetical protein